MTRGTTSAVQQKEEEIRPKTEFWSAGSRISVMAGVLILIQPGSPELEIFGQGHQKLSRVLSCVVSGDLYIILA